MDLVVSAQRIPEIGETISGSAFHTVPGGKGANQAVACAKLGADVSMLGGVGNDAYGKAMTASLQAYGVNIDHLAVLGDTTGIASIIHTPDDNCIVVVPGANGAFDKEQLVQLETQIAEASVLLVQLEIQLETVEAALAAAKQNGVITILNPAPAAELPEHMMRMADYMTPNETELEMVCKRKINNDEELEQTLRDWKRDYGCQLIVTRGSAGCSYLEDDVLHTAPALKVEVSDTTGAGDCFNGALAHGLSQGWPLSQVIPFAVTASSLSVTKFGAQAGMPLLQEVLDRQSTSSQNS